MTSPAAPAPPADPKDPPAPPADPKDPPAPDDPKLGPEGEQALAAFKDRARTAERDLKKIQKELEDLRSANATEQEKAIAAAKAEGKTEALEVANERLVKAAVTAAAAGKLAKPTLAVRLLDLDKFDVDEHGDVDTKAIESAIDALVKENPELAPAGRRPAPLPGGGATPSDGVSMDDWLRNKAKGR